MGDVPRNTMKKFFPLFVLILAFSGFLAGQVFFELIDSKAGSFANSKEKFGLYENLYKELELKTVSDEKINLNNIKAPVVILNFWASWCAPCLKEFPSLVALRNKYPKDKLSIIGINSDAENQIRSIATTKRDFKLNFDIIPDQESEITTKFLISEIPFSIIYYKGKVLEVSTGEMNFTSNDFLAKLDKIITEKN